MINNSSSIIPVIDISTRNTDQGKLNISREIHNAAKRFGFFYVKGHGIDPSLISNLHGLTKKFLSLPEEFKCRFKRAEGVDYALGYFQLGDKKGHGKNDDGYGGGGIDHKDGTYLLVQDEYMDHMTNRLYPNQDEEQEYGIVGYKNTIESYIKQVLDLSNQLLELIAISLNLPGDYFKVNDFNANPSSILGCLRYPSFHNRTDNEDDNQEKFGIQSHTDWGTITVLNQDDVGGLQVLYDGVYHDVNPIDGTFVINLGDMLEIMTKGYYLSNFHRVLYNRSGRDRYSFPLFVSQPWDTPIKVIDSIQDPPIRQRNSYFQNFRGTYRDYFKDQMSISFGDRSIQKY